MTLTGLAWQMLLCAAVLLAAVYFPGRVLVAGLRLRLDRLEETLASLAAGVALFMAAQWILGYAGQLRWLWLYAAMGCGLFAWMQFRPFRRPEPSAAADTVSWGMTQGQKITLAVLALLGAALQGALHFASGWETAQGSAYLTFHGHDAPWHVYNIYQMSRGFPPEMPGFAGQPLKNYHFLADFFWAGIRRLAPVLDPQHLYFRAAPVFNSLMLSLTVFIACRRIFKQSGMAMLAVVLTVFSAGFGYLLPLLTGKAYPLWESIFWVSPPFTLLFNPGVGASMYLLFAGLWGVAAYRETSQPRLLIYIGLVWGILVGFKVYAGLVVAAGLVGMSALYGLAKKDFTWFKIGASCLPVFLAVFLPVNAGSHALIRFMPGYALAQMAAAPDRMNVMSFDTLKGLYAHAPALLALLAALLAVVFVVGNLGVKTLGLIPMLRAIRHPLRSDPMLVFISLMCVVSLGAPLVIIQSGLQWQTIQFGYYAVLLAVIPTVMEFRAWTEKLSSARKQLAVLALVALGAPCVVQALWVLHWPYTIPAEELEAWRYLKTQTPPDAVIMRNLVPSLQNEAGLNELQAILEHGKIASYGGFLKKNRTQAEPAAKKTPAPVQPAGTPTRLYEINCAYVAGQSGRNTYLEDVVSSQIMGYPIEERIQTVRRVFTSADPAAVGELLSGRGIDYLLVFAGETLAAEPAAIGLTSVFRNAGVTIYRFQLNP